MSDKQQDSLRRIIEIRLGVIKDSILDEYPDLDQETIEIVEELLSPQAVYDELIGDSSS